VSEKEQSVDESRPRRRDMNMDSDNKSLPLTESGYSVKNDIPEGFHEACILVIIILIGIIVILIMHDQRDS
jgi:hypothetical protein